MPQVPHSHGHMAFPRTQNFDWVLLPHLPQMRFDLSGYHIPEKIEKGRMVANCLAHVPGPGRDAIAISQPRIVVEEHAGGYG